MNRKSRIILTGLLLCVVIGGGMLFLFGRTGEDSQSEEEIPQEVLAELMGEDSSTPAAVQNQNKQGDPRVTIDCEIPETPDKMEIVSWEYMDVTKDQEYLEELLKDNPEHREYKLKPRGGNDFHQSQKYPYFYLPYRSDMAGFRIFKNTEDGISRSSKFKFTKKEVIEKIYQVLEHFSLTAEPEKNWQIEKNGSFYDVSNNANLMSEKNYRVTMYPGYDGWPLLNCIYLYEVDKGVTDLLSPWEFCYGDIGWMEIELDNCMEMKGTGQYADIMSLEEATVYLAKRVGEYRISKANFGYWFGKNHTLRPYWYVESLKAYSYCIDAGTGDTYGPEEDGGYGR